MRLALQLLRESLEQQKRCEQLAKQEAELRAQLSLYSDKFDEFQRTLNKSNEVFGTFKKEMDKVLCFKSLSLSLSLSHTHTHTHTHAHTHTHTHTTHTHTLPVIFSTSLGR